MIKAMSNNGAILTIAAIFSTSLVVLTHTFTKDTIAAKEQAQLLATLNQVIPQSMYDNALENTCTVIQSDQLNDGLPQRVFIAKKGDNLSALAIETSAPDGYNGSIKILVGIDANNTVLGARVLQHNETPGLGDKIDLSVSDWILTFSGKKLESQQDKRWAVQKDGGQFDQFTGATITPRAVVNAVKQAAWYGIQHKESIVLQPVNCGVDV